LYSIFKGNLLLLQITNLSSNLPVPHVYSKPKAMPRLQMFELHKLSVKDKIKVVQTLWYNIAKELSVVELPAANKKFLTKGLKRLVPVMPFSNPGPKCKVNMLIYNRIVCVIHIKRNSKILRKEFKNNSSTTSL
jgi:hypothetical protein